VIAAATRRTRFAVATPKVAVPLVAALLAAVTVVVGQAIKAGGGALGVPFPPFYVHFSPHGGPLAAVSIGVLASAAALASTWIRRAHRPAVLAAFLFGLALSLGVGLNIARDGAHGLWVVFQTGPHGSLEAHQEYLPGLPALDRGVGFYVKHFPALIPSLPIHVKGNPPGPLVALHLLGIDTPGALAALCIGIGALTAPLAYDLGRTLGGEERGCVAGVLTAFSPALLLLGVTSADYAFATLGLAAACLLVRDRTTARVAGALAAATGAFFSWVLFAIPAWAVLVSLKRDGPRRAFELACISALATLVLYAVLAVSIGYDPIATLKATDAAYRHGISRIRPYEYWVLGSPVAWGIALGIPIGWAAMRASATRDPAALALAAVVIAGAILGFTKAETERIWLPFAPLACVAAGAVLPARGLRATLWLLVAQALAVELLFDTVW
jgi:hypothetical protein